MSDRRSFQERRLYGTTISNLSRKDSIATACYLFELTKDVSNSVISDESDFLKILRQLAKSLGLVNRIEEVMSGFVDHLVKIGKLHPISNDENLSDDEIQKGSGRRKSQEKNERKIYKEDEDIFYRRRECDSNEYVNNYLRIIHSDLKNCYAQIVYYVFFSKAKVNPEKTYKFLPSRFEKIEHDISRFYFLKKELDLSDLELEYLQIRYRKIVVDSLSSIFEMTTNNSNELYSKLLGVMPSEFNRIVRSDSKLLKYGFINRERHLSIALMDCIEAQDLNLYFSELITPVNLSDTYDLTSFCVPEKNTNIYKSMFKSDNPVSCLLYGKPGSGKSEYSKSLIKSTGKKAIIFRNEAEVSDKNDVLCRLNCLLSLKRNDTILIVDEADSILNTSLVTPFGTIMQSKTKGLVNNMLESSQSQVIFIVNYKNNIDDSTLRRFTVSYRFESMSPFMLEQITQKKLENIDVSDNARTDILKMITQYNVTGSSVDNMIKAINSMSNRDDKNLVENVEIVLKDNSMLLSENGHNMRENVNQAYDLSVLNTSIPAEKLMTMLNNAKNYAAKNPSNGAIRMLFHGLSGTGKTEFARYISQKLGKKILLKRASDIFDKYVGGTEENIAKAFNEAAEKDMILLFDEADSFFQNRADAKNGYEIRQVNEFLTQLEEFPGILICTTNLKEIMDSAMLRRFHITVDFKSLTEEGIEKLLKKYFCEYQFSQTQVHQLFSFNSVTPGDFGRLSGAVRFMSPEEISSDYIFEELCNIQKEKFGISCHKNIGFCA